jgi:hypothetical protein
MLAHLGDTYALIVLGSISMVWIIALLCSSDEYRSQQLRIGLSTMPLVFGGLFATDLSLIWKATFAVVAGFATSYVYLLVLPSMLMWRESPEQREEREWREWKDSSSVDDDSLI